MIENSGHNIDRESQRCSMLINAAQRAQRQARNFKLCQYSEMTQNDLNTIPNPNHTYASLHNKAIQNYQI